MQTVQVQILVLLVLTPAPCSSIELHTTYEYYDTRMVVL